MNRTIPNQGERAATRGIEVVIPEVEYCCMEAVRAILRADASAALGLILIARRLQGHLSDPYRSERLKLIEGRAYTQLEQPSDARASYQYLLNSTCGFFQTEAANYTKNGR
jgi:hypothetical protein